MCWLVKSPTALRVSPWGVEYFWKETGTTYARGKAELASPDPEDPHFPPPAWNIPYLFLLLFSQAPSYSEALGLFGETPPPTPTPLLPGNSCGWMRSWEPGHRGVRPRKEGRGMEVGFRGVSKGT